jgi:hypothetical protein
MQTEKRREMATLARLKGKKRKGSRLLERTYETGRLTFGKLLRGKTTGCHGKRSGADGTSTREVVRSVAYNCDLFWSKGDPVTLGSPRQSDWPKIQAFDRIVGEGAERKVIP